MVASRILDYIGENLKQVPHNRKNCGTPRSLLDKFDFTESFLTFQNVKTYSPQLVDIGVIYFGDEADFRRCHGILLWEKEFKFKYPPLERRVLWSVDDYVKVAAIAFVRLCLDSWNVLCNQTPSFLGRKKKKKIHIQNTNILLV